MNSETREIISVETPDCPPLRCVLVVDDEDRITWLLQEGLAWPGRTVLTAANGEEALQQLAANSVDLIITDYRMPGMDGLTLASYVRQLSPSTDIVMLTAFNTDSVRQEATQIGIKHLLGKPVKLPAIRHLVSTILNQR